MELHMVGPEHDSHTLMDPENRPEIGLSTGLSETAFQIGETGSAGPAYPYRPITPPDCSTDKSHTQTSIAMASTGLSRQVLIQGLLAVR